MEYLSVAEVLLLHARLIQRMGGSSDVCDLGLLGPALARPQMVDKSVAQARLLHPMPSCDSKICCPQLYCPQQSRLTAPIARNPKRRAVFLDRDGTVVEDIGYLTDPSQLKLLPGTVDGIRLLQDQFLIVIVTNQSAVARGLLDEERLLLIHRELAAALYNRGVFLDAVYACPHHPMFGAPSYRVQCYCRKPQPGMLLQAGDDFDIQPGLSFMIGDGVSDVLAGQRAGVAATVLIASHKINSGLPSNARPTYVASNLYEAAKLILDHWPRTQSS